MAKTIPLNGQMADIAEACGRLAQQRGRTQTLLAQIQQEQLAVSRKFERALREEISTLAFLKGAVMSLVLKARDLFVKPKSRSFEGITVGFEKERDSVTIPADEILIPRIRSLLKEKADLLIHTPPETVRRAALNDLSAQELQMLGVRRTTGADNAIVRLEKSDVEAQAAALLEALTPKAAEPKREAA